MWTYMMAAARGDRVNSMMSARRRNEAESPKYTYNRTRPMYRTTRYGNATSAGTSSGAPYAHSTGAGAAAIVPAASEMFHTHAAAAALQTTGAAAGTATMAAAVTGTGAGRKLQQPRVRLQASAAVTDEALVGEEAGASLYAPFTATTTLTGVDKDARIFHTNDATVCMVRKHLIAHQSGETVLRMPMQDADVVLSVTDSCASASAGGTSSGRRFKRRQQQQQQQCKCATLQQQQQQQQQQMQTDMHAVRMHAIEYDIQRNDAVHVDADAAADTDNADDDDEDDVVDDDDDDDDEDDDDDAVVDEEDAEELNGKATTRNMDALEKGKKATQDQTKRTKPSALRRTLNALRQRLTRRNRAKPPDWFLEKFSNTTNTDKLGKNAIEAELASEIRGSSVLCNHLSVNTTLQSHYRWLSIVSLAVLYNIIFVVGRAVFWELNRSATTLWYFLDYSCDFIYLMDTLVHMHEGYLDQGLLVRDAYKLRRNYFSTKGWYLDILSMLPTDLAYFWWPAESCSSQYLPCPVIMRLNRLLRLPRLLEWFDRTETATGYPNAFRICKVVLAILVLIHWNACMYFVISYELGFSSDNWVYNLNGTRNNTLQRQYIYSFYWSTLTLTTIGETPTPENDAEYLFVVADFLAGVLIFATIVGNIGSMISNMNVARVEFQNRMDGVKQYMAFRRVGHELEARVIRWFAYTWSQSGALDEERVLAALPDKLKAEIAIQVHMDTLKQVRIFHDTEPGLLEALVLKLKLQVFSPGDYICRKGDVGKEMYIVKRGKLSVVGDNGITVLATLGAGSVFGEVSVLEIAGNRTGNRRTANVRSLGYSDLFCLAKRDLWETLADYPEARSTLTQRGCQLLRKDGLLDENVFADSQRVHDSIESGIEKLEVSVENLNMRLARLLAEYTASQSKIKQRLAKLEFNAHPAQNNVGETQTRGRSGRLYSLQPKRRPRPRPASAAKSSDYKQNTL